MPAAVNLVSSRDLAVTIETAQLVRQRQFIVDQVGGYVDPIDGCVATSNGTFESSVRYVWHTLVPF